MGRGQRKLKLQPWKAEVPGLLPGQAQRKVQEMTIAHEEAVIDAAAVDAIFAEARTANSFAGEVTDEQARAIYELTKFGPHCFNSQPLRVTYVRSDEARAKLVDALSNGNKAKTASAPLVAILSYDTDWQGQWDKFLPAYGAPKAMYDADPRVRRCYWQQQRSFAGRLLHPRRALARFRCRPDDRCRLRRHRLRVLPGRRSEELPRGQHRPAGPGRLGGRSQAEVRLRRRCTHRLSSPQQKRPLTFQ